MPEPTFDDAKDRDHNQADHGQDGDKWPLSSPARDAQYGRQPKVGRCREVVTVAAADTQINPWVRIPAA